MDSIFFNSTKDSFAELSNNDKSFLNSLKTAWLEKLSSSNNQVEQLANILDERSIWQRYGL